jgi:hypothetical protein
LNLNTTIRLFHSFDKMPPPAATRHVDKLALFAIPTGNGGYRRLHYSTIGWSAVMQISKISSLFVRVFVGAWCQLMSLIYSLPTCNRRED